MPKELMDVATFNARYFSAKIGGTGGKRYQYLLGKLNDYHQAKGGTSPATHETMKITCEKILWVCADILTASKQPHDSEKKKVVGEIIVQTTNELKYLGRSLHMGLKPTASSAQVKQMYKQGVGQGFKEAKGGAPGSGTHRLDRGDFTGQTMHADNYWLEAYDKKHRPGFLLHSEWMTWHTNKDLSYAMSFWDWLDAREKQGDIVSKKGTDPKTKASIEMNVRYLTPAERKDHELTPTNGTLYDVNGDIYNSAPELTAFSGKGWAIYVMDGSGTLYAGSHIVGYMHHSSFLAGAPTRAAGELVVVNGKVNLLTGKSGHYKPTQDEVLAALDTLLGKGVMHGDAVVKPGFAGTDWFKAAYWQSQRGMVGPANAVTRAEILNVLPAGARGTGVMKLLPP